MNLEVFLVFVLGLSIGSFLNVVIYRLPEGGGKFFSSARSKCPFCETTIRLYDNIPLLSFALLRGRCRDCGRSISWQYPLVELLMAGITLALYQQYGSSAYFFVYILFFGLLLSCSIIDIHHRMLPDSLLLLGGIAGIVSNCFVLFPGVFNALIGLVAGIGAPLLFVCAYERLRHKTVIGGGDIKLIGMIGAFVGWEPLGLIIFYAAAGGTAALLLLKLTGKLKKPLPFAPFLSLATVMAGLYPDPPFFHIDL